MKNLRLQFFVITLIVILFSACDKNQVFEKYEKIPQSGWHKDSTIVFSVPVTDTLQNHNLLLNIRNDIKYNYSNLWLFIEINQPGEIAVTDTFEVMLANSAGKWLGDGFGGIKTRQIPYRSSVYFPVSGDYKISIQHGMRDETLDAITNVGIRVEKAK